jgi:hypothetical protein
MEIDIIYGKKSINNSIDKLNNYSPIQRREILALNDLLNKEKLKKK